MGLKCTLIRLNQKNCRSLYFFLTMKVDSMNQIRRNHVRRRLLWLDNGTVRPAESTAAEQRREFAEWKMSCSGPKGQCCRKKMALWLGDRAAAKRNNVLERLPKLAENKGLFGRTTTRDGGKTKAVQRYGDAELSFERHSRWMTTKRAENEQGQQGRNAQKVSTEAKLESCLLGEGRARRNAEVYSSS